MSKRWKVIVGALVALVVVAPAAAWGVNQLSSSTFDRLETAQVQQDAQGVRIALDYEVKLLKNYGNTNSIWDNSYQDVKTGNETAFVSDFAPDQMSSTFGLDAVLGVGPDGRLRVGGLAGDATGYRPVPPELSSPATLNSLYDAGGKSGTAKCGVLSTSTVPYLFCGFGAFASDGTTGPSGGLVFLTALSSSKLAALSNQLSLDLHVVPAARTAGVRPSTLDSTLGSLQVGTSFAGSSRIALDVSVPAAAAGQPVVLEALLSRPIHAAAGSLSSKLLILAALAALLAVAAASLVSRRAVRRRIHPLRETTEQIMNSGDRQLRIHSDAGGDIGGLAAAIDQMLDTLSEREAELAREHREQEAASVRADEERRQAELAVRAEAERNLSDTAEAVLAELDRVLAQAAQVRSSAGVIDERVDVAGQMTLSFVDLTGRTTQVVQELNGSLSHVRKVSELIASVAAQTNLLALNATIEAARAGEAGLGFSVVAAEVKELARTTAQSTTQISETISRIEEQAAAMSGALDGMSSGITGIEDATSAVGEVTTLQRAATEELNEAVSDAISRIRSLTRAGG
ncbi:MAG TPA: methyl-accepting chemotaxis protein [Jatrophihabitans sp.]|nr:methyl-accepting chemotaxis protein [Jatrophihabitans sp.]